MSILFKKVCQRCGGSGHLLRPKHKKTISFRKCTNCAGKGVRFKVVIEET